MQMIHDKIIGKRDSESLFYRQSATIKHKQSSRVKKKKFWDRHSRREKRVLRPL